MPAHFQLTLDTTGPQGVTASIDSNAGSTTESIVDLLVGTTDAVTVGYQVKVWGDVDGAPDEASAVWQAYPGPATPLAITLAGADGVKTIHVRLRDDVWNESASVADSIVLNQTGVTVNIIAGPDVNRVSRIATKRQATFTWAADGPFVHYEVRVVPDTNSDHNAGVPVGVVGSVNVAADGAFTANTPITTVVDGRDLPDPDSVKVVKVFARDADGNWSV